MDPIDRKWLDFCDEIKSDILYDRQFIYRGQESSTWRLQTSLHRTGQWKTPDDITSYMDQILPLAHEAVASWEGVRRDLTNPFQLAEFLAYLQHNGFPTPLLDWTYSPYIAAFFAFERINHFQPDHDHICIYRFDKEGWIRAFKQNYDYRDKNLHVSILEPSSFGNPKLMLQQGLFMYTNLDDIEGHIELNQRGAAEPYMKKYRINCYERQVALRELRLMNITRMQLFPSVESVCRKLATDVSLFFPMGKTRSQIATETFDEFLRSYKTGEK